MGLLLSNSIISMFKCPEAEVDRAEDASDEDGVVQVRCPVDVGDKLADVGESDVARIIQIVDVENDVVMARYQVSFAP